MVLRLTGLPPTDDAAETHIYGAFMLTKPMLTRADEAADLLSVLGNAKRLVILEHLLQNEMSVSSIADVVGLSQSALSQHLAKLRSHGLVETRRDRQMIYYSCDSEDVRKVLDTLKLIYLN